MSIHAEPDERSGKRLGARLACAQRHKKARSVERALNPLVEYRGLEQSLRPCGLALVYVALTRSSDFPLNVPQARF